MKLSVVVPAYNEEEVLGPCLQTILSALKNSPLSPEEYEVIVVNNASTDRTKEVALSFPSVRVVDEPRKGLTRAKEAGFRTARGEILADPDADTLMPKDWISRVLPQFSNSKVVAVSGPYIYYDASPFMRMVIRLWFHISFIFHIFAQYFLHAGAMIQGGNYAVRRSALEQINGYNTDIEFYGEDFDIASRLSKVGRVKWCWKLNMYTSSRRLAVEGTIMTALRYGMNNVASVFLKKPLTQHYKDIRPPVGKQAQEMADRILRNQSI